MFLLSNPPAIAATQRLSELGRYFVAGYRFEGNTVFTDTELSAVLNEKGFVGRELTFEEFEQARRELTWHYVRRGYLNSGAVLVDEVTDDHVTFRIVEGKL